MTCSFSNGGNELLYHIGVTHLSTISVPELKALAAFLTDADGGRPTKAEQIAWLDRLTTEGRERGFLARDMRLVQRSSAPVPVPSLMFRVRASLASVATFEIVDGDVRLAGFDYDFLDNVWFRFRSDGPVETNGMTDEDWILARLSDTQGIIV
jgi:hypothetical protein